MFNDTIYSLGGEMIIGIVKVLVSACLISFVSWYSGKNTSMAGFLTALPLTTLLALFFSNMEWSDGEQSVAYAKSVFVAIPVTLMFFVPFLVSKKFNLGFWTCYLTGVVLLGIGYFIHSKILEKLNW